VSEVAGRADFSRVRYAQCWEDADVLLDGLAVRPGDVCLSIASAGDNSLALLTADPARVIAVDLNPSQLHCVALRIAAYRRLAHHELLELIGSRPAPARRRLQHYHRCRRELDDAARRFWDARGQAIAAGVGGYGKFQGRLVKKLAPGEFEERWQQYQAAKQQYDQILEQGDTVNDAIVQLLQEHASELLLEE